MYFLLLYAISALVMGCLLLPSFIRDLIADARDRSSPALVSVHDLVRTAFCIFCPALNTGLALVSIIAYLIDVMDGPVIPRRPR